MSATESEPLGSQRVENTPIPHTDPLFPKLITAQAPGNWRHIAFPFFSLGEPRSLGTLASVSRDLSPESMSVGSYISSRELSGAGRIPMCTQVRELQMPLRLLQHQGALMGECGCSTTPDL